MCTTVYPAPDWATIRTVLLDMDGTLLDRAFDDHFYLEALPAHYAAANRMPVEAARERLVALYRAVEGGLGWADADYRARKVELHLAAPGVGEVPLDRNLPRPDEINRRVLPPHSPVQLGVSPSRPRRPGCTPRAACGHPCGVTRSIATGVLRRRSRCRRGRRGGGEWGPGGAEGGTPESAGLRQGSRLSTSGGLADRTPSRR